MQSSPKTLLLGNTRDLVTVDDTSGQEIFMSCSDFEQLDEKQLADLRLDVVASLFVCGTLDCLEIGQRLVEAGFSGRYYVLIPELPDPQIIVDEITQSCPSIDIQVVTNPLLI